jgi:hypothetical protein
MIDHAIAARKRIAQHPSNAQLKRHLDGLVRLNILLAKSERIMKESRNGIKQAAA